MQLAESIKLLTEILGRGEKTESEERRYRIELTALLDLYRGNPYNESRWNVSEQYHYREAWVRGSDQIAIEGKGDLATYMKGAASCDKPTPGK